MVEDTEIVIQQYLPSFLTLLKHPGGDIYGLKREDTLFTALKYTMSHTVKVTFFVLWFL